jgi:NAD(P)-dependent dehydrogenase (short-subunit alcohol dehydrogenase family)
MSTKAIMNGKFYAITGAGSGIGRATAIRCTELGAAGLTLCDLSVEGLEVTKKLMYSPRSLSLVKLTRAQ